MKRDAFNTLVEDLANMVELMVGPRFMTYSDISYEVAELLEQHIEVEEGYDVEFRPPDGYVVKTPPKTIDMCGFTYRLEEKKDD